MLHDRKHTRMQRLHKLAAGNLRILPEQPRKPYTSWSAYRVETLDPHSMSSTAKHYVHTIYQKFPGNH